MPVNNTLETSYLTELWEFSDKGVTRLYNTENGQSETIQNDVYDSDGISFIIRQSNEYQKITINDDQIKRTPFLTIKENERVQIIPLKDSVLVSYYSKGDESNHFEDVIENYLISEYGTLRLEQSYDFISSIHVGNKVFLISDNNSGLYAIYENDETVYIDTIENISYPVSFKNINDHELLVDANDLNAPASWNLIKIIEDE